MKVTFQDSEQDSFESSRCPQELELFLKDQHYEKLTSGDIESRQCSAIMHLADALDLDLGPAAVMLIENRWSPYQVIGRIYSRGIGELVKKKGYITPTSKSLVKCRVCQRSVSACDTRALECDHEACLECYTRYLEDAVVTGRLCARTKCPVQQCQVLVPEALFKDLLIKDRFETYKIFVCQSYADGRKDVGWCFNPSCHSTSAYLNKTSYEICCGCEHIWCFRCGQDSHRPLSCEECFLWQEKSSAEYSKAWIWPDMKNCPNCMFNVKNTTGLLRIICKCGYTFCWHCLQNWYRHHNSESFSCIKFSAAGISFPKRRESIIKQASDSLSRLQHYYRRYKTHKVFSEKAAEKALQAKIDAEYIRVLMKETSMFNFFYEAACDVSLCLRYLSFSYAFEYFLSSVRKLQIYEQYQRRLEQSVGKLEELLAMDLKSFLTGEENSQKLSPGLSMFRSKVNDARDKVEESFVELRRMEIRLDEMVNDGEKLEDKGLASLINFNLAQYWICMPCKSANQDTDDICSACMTPRSS